ncbi:hypothetical protein Tco_0428124 [Tanacetum coccineum]
MVNDNCFFEKEWLRRKPVTKGSNHQQWYQSPRFKTWEKPIKRQLQCGFKRRQLQREIQEASMNNCVRQLTRDCKEMLRQKIKDIEAFNSVKPNTETTTKIGKIPKGDYVLEKTTWDKAVKKDHTNTDFIRMEDKIYPVKIVLEGYLNVLFSRKFGKIAEMLRLPSEYGEELEHFEIKLEDSDDEGNKQQPSAKGTENVKLQKDYEDFKMKGLAAIEEGDQEDNTSTSKGMVKKKTCDEGIESPTSQASHARWNDGRKSEWNFLPFLLRDSSWLTKLLGVSSTKKLQGMGKFLFTQIMGEITRDNGNEILCIPGVHYAPEVTLNVLSESQLEAQGVELNYNNNRCRLSYMFKHPEACKFDEYKMKEKQNQYLEKYFDSIDPKGDYVLEKTTWDKAVKKDHTDTDFIRMEDKIYPVKFGKIAEMLGLPSEYGKEVKKCYNVYLDIVKCNYNTTRVPKVCEKKKATVMAEEGCDQAYVEDQQDRVGLERKAQLRKKVCGIH